MTPDRRNPPAIQDSNSEELPFLVYATLVQATWREPALGDDPLYQSFLVQAYDRFVAEYEVRA